MNLTIKNANMTFTIQLSIESSYHMKYHIFPRVESYFLFFLFLICLFGEFVLHLNIMLYSLFFNEKILS